MATLFFIKLLSWEFLHYNASGGSLHAVLQYTKWQFKLWLKFLTVSAIMQDKILLSSEI